jgi:addiction module HigA family antidote
MKMQMFNPPHPGPAIKEALEYIPMTVTEFAAYIGVSRVALSRVLNGRAGVTAEMSIRISEAFGQGSSAIWFRMQAEHDFWQASHVKRKKIKKLKIVAEKVVVAERPHRTQRARKVKARKAKGGGQCGTRTPDILLVRQAL